MPLTGPTGGSAGESADRAPSLTIEPDPLANRIRGLFKQSFGRSAGQRLTATSFAMTPMLPHSSSIQRKLRRKICSKRAMTAG